MNRIKVIIILVMLAVVLRWIMNPEQEGFSGAITQLTSRGPQDLHLTINTEKYVDPYYSWRNPSNWYTWNSPTRYFSPYYYYDYISNIFPYIYYKWWY